MTTEHPTNWFGIDALECGEAWIQADETIRWRTNRPFDPGFPFSTDVETAETMLVYVEVDPGNACERHTHDVEEVVLVHRGTLEFTLGDEVSTRTAGEVGVVPADVPHAFRNVGDGPATVIGLLPTRATTTRFEREVQPIGIRVMGPDGPAPEGARHG